MGVLKVTLNKIMNLRDKDHLGRSDPYVIFDVEKHRIGLDKYYGKKESSRKQGTCNPEYNETFTWHDIPDDLDNIFLDIKIYDEDIGRDDKIGQVEVNLEHAGLTHKPKAIVAVVDPKKWAIFSEEATIHMHISFKKDNK